MGKRTDFKRIPKDKYYTKDPGPVRRLQAHLPAGLRFVEPCAGAGDLIKSMVGYGHECVYACDIAPGHKTIIRRNALTLDRDWRKDVAAKMFVSNPPWTRPILHDLIDHLSSILPTWLLIDADWMHTGQAAPYVDRCAHVVSVGRVRWIPGTTKKGYENTAWFYFPRRPHTGGPRFTGLQ